MLKQATADGPRLHVRDLGELLYLVTHITFSKGRVASVLKVVDPVYEIDFLDEPQCQFVVERVRNVLRAENMQSVRGPSSGQRADRMAAGNFHMPGEHESPDFECCTTCTLPSDCSPSTVCATTPAGASAASGGNTTHGNGTGSSRDTPLHKKSSSSRMIALSM